MNIAVDVLSIRVDGSAGGATGFALELIKGFAALEDNKVVVLCADWNIEYLKSILPSNIIFCQMTGQGVNTKSNIINKGIMYIDNMLRKNTLRKHNIDILFCPFSAATYRSKDIPTVSTILDIQHEYYPQFFDANELRARRSFYRDIVTNVERVVCISDYTKKTFCEKYGFPEKKAETIYIAVQNRFKEEDRAILKKLDIKEAEYLVYSANFWEHKNHKLLLTAYAMYVHNGGSLKLVLTGNPLSEQEFYDNMINTMGLNGKVLITGYVSEKELYAILLHSKGLIYPSLFEGFGIPVVEAMYMNKLIACSNMTSLPEIGCEAICYFDPRKPDEILRGIEYIDNNHVTEELKTEYSNKLKEYQTDVMIQKYMDVFKDTIENREKYLESGFLETVDGIYTDGWASKRIVICKRNCVGSKISMRISWPTFAVGAVEMKVNKGTQIEQIRVKRGESLQYDIPITEPQFKAVFEFSRTWNAAWTSKGQDLRRLSVKVEELKLIDEYGNADSILS